jgi:hypothetical protein
LDENRPDKYKDFEERFALLGESEMAMFRFLLDKPAGVILTVETDKMLAQLLERESLVLYGPGDKVIIPDEVRETYEAVHSDELTLKWRKHNWMYKCIEAGKYLYGVMSYEALRDLFALRYPRADMVEIMDLFDSTPLYYQWFTERDGKLVLNGFEKNDYYKYLEQQVQADISYYVPTIQEVEELYEQGSLISRESHQKMKKFIEETFSCGHDTAALKLHELYETVNNHMRINDAVEAFARGTLGAEEGNDAGSPESHGAVFEFPSDEIRFKFTELYIEMSRECRIRDNRGHDYYEMVAIMSLKNRAAGTDGGRSVSGKNSVPVKRVKIGRNDPCPCGSGKKYKNCCGRS